MPQRLCFPEFPESLPLHGACVWSGTVVTGGQDPRPSGKAGPTSEPAHTAPARPGHPALASASPLASTMDVVHTQDVRHTRTSDHTTESKVIGAPRTAGSHTRAPEPRRRPQKTQTQDPTPDLLSQQAGGETRALSFFSRSLLVQGPGSTKPRLPHRVAARR